MKRVAQKNNLCYHNLNGMGKEKDMFAIINRTFGILAESEGQGIAADLQNLEEMAESGALKSYLEGLVPGLLGFALRVVVAVIIYFIGGKLIKWLRKILQRALERGNVDQGVRQFLDSCTKIVLYFLLIVIVINQLGIETTSVVAVLGSAGLTVGLALQGSLSNFAGGVLILLFKPFKVGDYIIEDTHKNEGTVSEIMIFYTKLFTVDNKVIVIPNGVLANASLTNATQQQSRRLDLSVGISYESDIQTAKQVLLELLQQDPARIPEKEIDVFVDALEDSSVKLGCRMWVKAEEYWKAKWRLTEAMKGRLEEAGIQIPFNQLTVSMVSETKK